jgi:bifunctional oligoribonuclease and PAP phosphatase NrnA
MQNFNKEFNTLNYVIKKSDSILLFAHTHPDGDAVGSVLALKYYIENLGKYAAIACFDPFPSFLENLFPDRFEFPAHLDIKSFDLIIACDAVERGFQKILPEIKNEKIIALLDHHSYVSMKADINIIDTQFSSVCEILYQFFTVNKIEITKKIATALLLGILNDTGSFQHSNTTPRVMEIASSLMKKGAPLTKIIEGTFSNKNISTLKLWGRAFEKAKVNPQNGMIISVLTKKDINELGATTDDIAQVAQILNTVPGTKFSLILSERDGGFVKGSLRSEEYKGVDVSKIASEFGGGGHKLASGFEIKGKIVETIDGWKIV